MKITGAVVLVLIAGILGSTNSQSSESTLESACIKNGGPNAWENLQIAKSNIINCIESVKTEIRQGLHSGGVGIDPVLRLYCNKLQISKDCIRNLMGSVNPCLEPDQRLLASQNMDVTLKAMEFMCSYRLLLTVVYATADHQCIDSKIDGLINCGHEMLFGSNSTELTPELFSFNNQTCSNVQKFVQCELSLFQPCASQLLTPVLNPFFSSLSSGILCTNLQGGGLGNILSSILAPITNQVVAPVTNQLLPGLL